MLRRAPLKRGKPPKRTGGLARKTRLKQKRAKPRRSSRKIDKAHLAFVRTLPCCVCNRRPPSDPHHETAGRGLSQKSDDDRAIPLCRVHHDAAQFLTGEFKGWDKERMRPWHAEQVAAVHARKVDAA